MSKKHTCLGQLPIIVVSIVILITGTGVLRAQTLNKPTPAENPNYTGNSAWTAVCANASFNEYFVNFTWNTPVVDSKNEFILELSDADGNFANALELDRIGDKNTIFDFDFDFVLPANTRGDGYRLRVRSTSPAKTSAESDAFSMYYTDYNTSLLISPDGNGTIPSGGTIELCDINSVTIAAHNIPNADTYQYNWYRSGTLLATEKGSSIKITTSGIYNVQIDYGDICSGSANTLSNTIDITTGISLGLAINPPVKTALCSGETLSLQANITGRGLTYIWYKDKLAITSATVDDYTYVVDSNTRGFEGDYSVQISGPEVCSELSAPISITNIVEYTVSRVNDAELVILPDQTKTLSVTTTANSPKYQWYKDGVSVSGATNNSINITEAGVYYTRVSQEGGVCTLAYINSETTTVVATVSFELIADYTTSYTDCKNTSIVIGIQTVKAIASDASKTDVTTDDLLNSFTYRWKKDGTSISGATSNTISLTSISENGNYTVEGVLNKYSATSNPLTVQLINESLTISSSNLTYCNAGDAVAISTETNLASENFEWLKDGVGISTADTRLKVRAAGKYQLIVLKNGCRLKSNEIVISPLDESLISIDAQSDTVLIPEGSSRTLTASGGTSYRWLSSDNKLMSDTASATFKDEGTYILIANIGACEITKQITIMYSDTFKVPNVITANADGINDLWVLPNSYSNDPKVTVIIYNSTGEEILNTINYKNNWPQSSMAFPKQNMVFYYKIKKAKEILKQGTVTIIR